jgi:3D (Asp-Asp-Asp) domain-containing protein
MKKQLLALTVLVSLIITSSGWVTYYDGYENMKDIVVKQDEKIKDKSSEIAKLENVVAKKVSEIQSQDKVIDKREKEIDKKNSEIKKLKEEIENFKKEKERSDAWRQAIKNKKALPSRGSSETKRTVNVLATSYIALCDTGCTGKTATGIDVRNYPSNSVIAVDPSVIPLHSKVRVDLPNGDSFFSVAEDTGGAIKGYRIDILKASYNEAVNFGEQNVTVTILN